MTWTVPALRGAVDGAGEAHTHIDTHTGAFHDSIERGFVGWKGEIGEETE